MMLPNQIWTSKLRDPVTIARWIHCRLPAFSTNNKGHFLQTPTLVPQSGDQCQATKRDVNLD